MNELTALFRQRPAGAGQGQGIRAGAVKILRREIGDGAAVWSETGGEDLARHPGDQADEVRVVNVQIDGGPAGFAGIGDLVGPVRLSDDALEVSAEQLAVRSRANAFGGEGELREERQHVRHHEQLAGLGAPLATWRRRPFASARWPSRRGRACPLAERPRAMSGCRCVGVQMSIEIDIGIGAAGLRAAA